MTKERLEEIRALVGRWTEFDKKFNIGRSLMDIRRMEVLKELLEEVERNGTVGM